jgi:hypothetical protein
VNAITKSLFLQNQNGAARLISAAMMLKETLNKPPRISSTASN